MPKPMQTFLPHMLQIRLEQYLGEPIRQVASLGGGCIANACAVETTTERVFLKWGTGAVAATFTGEAAGLQALHEAQSPLLIPKVLAVESEANHQPGFLLLEWITPGPASRAFAADFGQHLAQLHRQQAEAYGFVIDNHIGRLPQTNAWCDTWPDFFRKRRLLPQIERARSARRWPSEWNALADHILNQLENWLPLTPEASILHGDLWSGNFLVTVQGRAALIDPAAYYGHREADLAMTELFGGFDAAFYTAYCEAWPLEPGYERRRDLYNLYHLINHLNHFGSGYAGSVAQILRRYG